MTDDVQVKTTTGAGARLRWVVGCVIGAAMAVSAACATPSVPVDTAEVIQPMLVTDAVADDADDPAIWLNRADPGNSLIIGTNKVAAPNGALVVFGLDGKTRQTVSGIDRPNNVDVEYGFVLGGRPIDIVVTTERLKHQLRIFQVTAAGLTGLGAVPVLAGETGPRAEPMGIALYRRPADGAIFAIVAPKLGASSNYLWQYRLDDDGRGGVKGTLVRRFGAFSEKGPAPGEPGEIEAVVVDDEHGYVYYADERFGIHKWYADPDHPDAAREISVIGTSGYQLDREGLAIYQTDGMNGFLVSSDQIPNGTVFKIYRREGEAGAPHVQPLVGEVHTPADSTDGLEVTSAALPGFPHGMVVAMNSAGRNFMIFRWEDVDAAFRRSMSPR